MAFQGMMSDVDGHGGEVVFTFGGQVHEVHLPAVPYYKDADSDESCRFVREEATTVLQCLTSRAALELQHALAAAGQPAAALIQAPPFLSELYGSFGDLVRQLQECVDWRRKEKFRGNASADLLVAAASLCHASTIQQLLLFNPRQGCDESKADYSPAHQAALQPHGAAVLKLLLAAAPEVLHSTCNYNSNEDWTLMHSAAEGGNAEGIRLLLQRAPKLTSARSVDGSTPLHAAAGGGSTEAVRLLLQAAPKTIAARDSVGGLPMHRAARHGHIDIIRILIDAGGHGLGVPGLAGNFPLHEAALGGREAAVRLLLTTWPAAAVVAGFQGCLPLHLAAEHCSAAAVDPLLNAYPAAAQVQDDHGRLPLHHAAMQGDGAVIQLLLAANPAAAQAADRSGNLPLHLADGRSSAAAIRLLLAAHPAAILVKGDKGRLPLHEAARWGCDTAVRMLLAANPAAALVKDSEGRLPLHLALRYRRLNAARALLPASGLSAAQLLNLLAAVPAQAQPLIQPLYAELAAHMSLTPEQWQRVPAPCDSLGRALPAVLARSEAEAALLMAHLPTAEAERLHTAALSLRRRQCSLQLEAAVPAALVGKMLALSLADS